jgi:hypothetical protein
MTTQTFHRDNFTVLLSLNERAIYLKLTDNVNFVAYERNLDPKELQLANMELAAIHQIVTFCLAGTNPPDYDAVITVTASGTMQIQFKAVVGGFLKLNFSAFLQEKVLSNDAQLSTQFYRMEQQYGALMRRIQDLEAVCAQRQSENEELMDRIGCAEVYLGALSSYNLAAMSYTFLFPINSTTIVVPMDNPWLGHSGNVQADIAVDPSKIELFYRLQKLTLYGGERYNKSTIVFKNQTLKTFELKKAPHLTSLEGIHQLPSLESLTVEEASGLTNVPAVLASYKHNIKELTFKACPNINVVELQTYCQTNGIKLNIS